MNISKRLKERFCKDCNIPIKIFEEPYFMSRLLKYDNQYDTVNKYLTFIKEYKKYPNEEAYFADYNRVKDEAINFIKSQSGYVEFNNKNMSVYEVKSEYSQRDIYKPTNVGKTFISIDMKQANFNALKDFDGSIFDWIETYKDFLSKFTDNEHFKNSKYIRQVIFGSCNPKRQTTYEKYMMSIVLEELMNGLYYLDNVVSFSNDEIVFDITDWDKDDENIIINIDKFLSENFSFPLKVELFHLQKIYEYDIYIKFKSDGTKEIKKADPLMLPLVLTLIEKSEPSDHDMVFYHNGLLCKIMDFQRETISYEKQF